MDLDQEILNDFITEAMEMLDPLDEMFVALENDPESSSIIDSIFRPVHSMKGSCSFIGLSNVSSISHKMENLLVEIREKKIKVNKPIIDILLSGIDILKEILTKLEQGEKLVELRPKDSKYIENLVKVIECEKRPKEAVIENFFNEINSAVAALQKENIQDKSLLKNLSSNLNTLQKITKSFESQLNEVLKKERFHEAKPCISEGINVDEYVTFFRKIKDDNKDKIIAKGDSEKFLIFAEELLGSIRHCKDNTGNNSVSDLVACFLKIVKSGEALDEEKSQKLEEAILEIERVIPQERKKIGEIFVDNEVITKETAEEILKLQDAGSLKKFGELLKEKTDLTDIEIQKGLKQQSDQSVKKTESQITTGVGKTMRIDEEKIDTFMNTVGELIISSEVFNYIQKKLENTKVFPEISKEFKKANMSFNELSNALQMSLMDVRKVSIKPIVQKIPRMIREISTNLDKKVLLHISGEDERIDKSLMESLEAPLVHIIRNAVDHGIESPSFRKNMGKPEEGAVEITASHDNNFFYLTVSDDGAGLNSQKLKESALKKGVIDEHKYNTMTEKDAYDLIFMPGFSTAEVVTDVSGRGVGMDVVMQNLKKANGAVDIESKLNAGTKFQIKLPLKLTLIVVDGLLIKVGEESFIIPLKFIKESIRPKPEDIITVEGKGEMVNIRESLFPMIRLHKLFDIVPVTENPSESLVVAVEDNGMSSCLLVDEIVSQQQVVLKDLGDKFKSVYSVSGGAIMGDGRVGLVLNIEKILECNSN